MSCTEIGCLGVNLFQYKIGAGVLMGKNICAGFAYVRIFCYLCIVIMPWFADVYVLSLNNIDNQYNKEMISTNALDEQSLAPSNPPSIQWTTLHSPLHDVVIHALTTGPNIPILSKTTPRRQKLSSWYTY